MMNAVLLCSTGQNEVDCINVGAILIRFSDGKTIALTEDSLRRVDLEYLDASSELEGWLRTRANEFSAGAVKPAI
jgi:hypothetical protein